MSVWISAETAKSGQGDESCVKMYEGGWTGSNRLTGGVIKDLSTTRALGDHQGSEPGGGGP